MRTLLRDASRGVIALLLMAGFVVACQKPAEPDVATTPPAAGSGNDAVAKPGVVVDRQPMSLGITPLEFRDRFNSVAAKHRVDARVNTVQLKANTEVSDSWTYRFSARMAFIAPVNRRDGMIRSINVVWNGDGTKQTVTQMIVTLDILLRAVDPALADKTASRLTLDLFYAVGAKEPVERVLNGVSYTAAFDKSEGLLLVGIAPVQK